MPDKNLIVFNNVGIYVVLNNIFKQNFYFFLIRIHDTNSRDMNIFNICVEKVES